MPGKSGPAEFRLPKVFCSNWVPAFWVFNIDLYSPNFHVFKVFHNFPPNMNVYLIFADSANLGSDYLNGRLLFREETVNCVCCHVYEFGFNLDWPKMAFLTLTFHLISSSWFKFLPIIGLLWDCMTWGLSMNCLMDLICNVCRSSSGPTTVHIIKSSNSIRKTDILFSNISLSHYLFARLMI